MFNIYGYFSKTLNFLLNTSEAVKLHILYVMNVWVELQILSFPSHTPGTLKIMSVEQGTTRFFCYNIPESGFRGISSNI